MFLFLLQDTLTLFAPVGSAGGNTITATLSSVDCTPITGAGHFTLSGTAATVASWSISGATITLTLAGHTLPGETVTLTYTRSNDATDIVDWNGNALVNFSGLAVTNGSDNAADGSRVQDERLLLLLS